MDIGEIATYKLTNVGLIWAQGCLHAAAAIDGCMHIDRLGCGRSHRR